MIDRFIRNFLNAQHIIHKIRHVQTVRLTFLHQCIKNECPPAAVLSFGARAASSSSSSDRSNQRPKLSNVYSNNGGSQLLDDYHNHRAANLQLADLGNHIVEFAQDPQGSSFIQQKLEHANPTETAQLVDELRGHVLTLALHKNGYGSRVIECLLEHCTEQQKRPVLEQLHGNVLSLVTDKYGSFVIRHVIEHGLPEDREPILRSLHENVLTLATDKYGVYVIEHLIKHGLPEDREPIVRSLQENITSLSVHKCGCRVIKRVIDHCTEHQKRHVLEQLHGNVLFLVTDKYGSFVIEHVIEHGLPEDRERIVRILQGDILKNAHNNSICNIINKCFIFGTTEQRNALIDQVCADNGSGSPPLLQMMKHPFGNKVVQNMLNVADSARRQKMMLAIKTAPIKNTANRSPESLTKQTLFKHSKGAAPNNDRIMAPPLDD
uniref:PUM-HD domain-containing protein n=1 Tax=Globodera pallida TaxID=36090 RepID=A0A183C9F1_GLOPA